MSVGRALARFTAGTTLGFVGVFFLLPEAAWPGFHQYFYLPLHNSLYTLKFWWTYYNPSAVRYRKQQEILAEREALLQPITVQESPQDLRRKVKFMSEVNYEIRRAETLATVQGLYRREREDIIFRLMRKHYPELFPEGPEILKEELERKRRELQEGLRGRVTNAPEPKHDGIV